MVITVALHPNFKEICIRDSETKKCFKRQSSINVMSWEAEMIEKYIKEIIKIVEKPIDYFYVILSGIHLNEFRQKIIKVSKQLNIKNCEIVNGLKEDVVIALNYVTNSRNFLWIFNYYDHGIYCEIWDLRDGKNLKLVTYCYQQRITHDDNPSIEDLLKLKKQIMEALYDETEPRPILVVFQKNKEIDAQVYKTAFSEYQNIFFHNTNSFTYSFLQCIQNMYDSNVKDILERNIEVIYDNVKFLNISSTDTIPVHKSFRINLHSKNAVLKVYENQLLTKEVLIKERGNVIVDFIIDKNGIFFINIEKKPSLNNMSPTIENFTLSENPDLETKIPTTFDIPLKLADYDMTLNAVGIDLGTSECCASVIRKSGPDCVVLDLATAQRNLPSYINLNLFQNICGQLAIDKMVHNPEFSVFDIKRLLGKTFNEIVIDPLWPFKIVDYYNQISVACGNPENANLSFRTSTTLCSILIKHIKEKIDEYQGTILTETVITIPSSFSQKQKEATIDAAKKAGWQTIHLIPEPIAAVFAYSYEKTIPNNSTILMFDCGGGTTDICVAKIFDNQIKIIIDHGDFFLGGKDFDKLLINYFSSVLKHKYEINVFETKIKYRLMIKCREIKHTLSIYEHDNIYVDDFNSDKDGVIPIQKKEFEDLAIDLILRSKNLISEILKKVNLSSDDIDIVFQVGGGCRMPMIKKMLIEMFPKSQHQCSIYPEWMVAHGAALYAYSLKPKKKVKKDKTKYD